MRKEPNLRIENSRRFDPQSPHGANYGMFQFRNLRIISSGNLEGDWEHVSVSTNTRCPTWQEMCQVKQMFWSDDETVIQFHPAKSDYVNVHPHCLHLWKKVGPNIELPPTEYV